MKDEEAQEDNWSCVFSLMINKLSANPQNPKVSSVGSDPIRGIKFVRTKEHLQEAGHPGHTLFSIVRNQHIRYITDIQG